MYLFFKTILQKKYWVLGVTFLLLVWSTVSLNKLNISAVPDVTNKQVVVNTKTGSLSTEQIEKIVTYPIETELSGLQGVHEVRSLSKYGLSQVVVVFEDQTDLYFARQLINEKLQAVKSSLPDKINPQLGPVTTGLGEIFMWILELKTDSDKINSLTRKEQLQYLRRVQDYTIRPYLKKVSGVAEVDTNGGHNTEVHINYSPEKLDMYGINISEAIEAIESIGTSFGGAYINVNGQQITIRSFTPLDNLSSVENIVVKKMPSGKNIIAKDVFDIRYDSSLRVGGATYDGKETVLGTILMRVGSNSRLVSQQVEKALKTIKLPEDVNLKVVYNRKLLVNKTITTVIKNLLEGAALVLVVLMLILGNLRASLIVSLAIPISLLIALRGMSLYGISANLMSLGAIDFGLLVDASVVLVENFIRRLSSQTNELTAKERLHILSSSCAEVAKPVIYGLAIIMIVYLPILFLEGVEGKMFKPMALTVLMALAMSLVVALFITPVLLYIVFRKNIKEKTPLVFKYLSWLYEPSLKFSLKNRSLILLVSVGLFVSSIFIFFKMGSDFVPQLDEGDMVIGLVRDSKQNIDASIEEQMKAEDIIKTFEEVSYVFSRIGTPESATDPMSPNFADTFLMLNSNKEQWPLVNGQRRTKSELFLAIKEKLIKEMDDQDISYTQPIEMRFNEILEGSRADVTLRFLGPDLDKLIDYAKAAEQELKKIEGVQSVEFDALTGLTKSRVLDIKVSSDKAQYYGLNINNINENTKTLLSGKEVGTFFLENIKIPLVFHLDESLRDNVSVIKKLLVPHPDGGSVPLDKLAEFDFREKVTTIARLWAQRYSAVSIYIGDGDLNTVVKKAQETVREKIDLESSYNVEWGGQYKNLIRARAKLAIIVPITLLVIFFIILSMTDSLYQATVIFSAIPMGVSGGVYLLFLRGMNFSVSAAIGFIALSGIVVLNSMVLVNFINQIHEPGKNLLDSIIKGAKSRLRPVIMTALVAGLGFFPMAFNTGMGAEVQRPLATVVIGGLFTSTFLTMLVVPVLLSFYGLKKKIEK